MGRGVPDIALQSSSYVMVYKAKDSKPDFTHVASGTSCSTNVRLYDSFHPPSTTLRFPSSITRLSFDVQTAAAIFSLLNDFRLAEGKAPLGWLNPWLYGAGWTGYQDLPGFTDIIAGTNPGCGTLGFSAIPGWDPVRPARAILFVFDFC